MITFQIFHHKYQNKLIMYIIKREPTDQYYDHNWPEVPNAKYRGSITVCDVPQKMTNARLRSLKSGK